MYDLDAFVLLLGVGHDRNTSLHLAQYRSGSRPWIEQSGPVTVAGDRRWLTWLDIDLDDTEDFSAVGHELDESKLTRCGTVGHAVSSLMRQRRVVDYAIDWFKK